MDIADVVIIGAGPAGIATAIQLRRYHIQAVLLEQEEIGGLLRNAHLVENYPGFPAGIRGSDLVGLFKEQLKNAGVGVSFERAVQLRYEHGRFVTRTDRRTIASSFAVVAAGTKPRKSSVPAISADIEDRIFYEIHPIQGIEHKKIAIIGAGDAAFDYALSLSQNNEVTIVSRSERAKCLPVLEERCRQSEKTSFLSDASVGAIEDQGGRLRLTYASGTGRKRGQICADMVIMAIGREPCLDFLGTELNRRSGELMEARALFMVGDVKNEMYRQTAICVGDGVQAAMKIYGIMGIGKA